MQSAALCDEHLSLPHRAFNIFRNIASLRFERIGSLALVRNDMQLTVGSVALGIFSGGVERLGVVIFKLARLRAHQLAEDIVDARCNSHAASEIRAEGYAQGVFPTLKAVCCAAAAQEYLRHRLTESVYALLDIADGEQIILVGRYRSEYHILRFVYILILVDEYLNIMRRQLARKVGFYISAAAVGNREQIECAVQNIREIGGVHFILFGGILPAKLLDEFYKLRHGIAQQAHVIGVLFGRYTHDTGHFFQQILELFAGGSNHIFRLALIALRNAPETHILDRFKRFESLVPVAVDFFSKLGVHIYIALHRRAVGIRHNRVGLHGGHHIAARGHAVVEHIADIFFYYTAPAALVDIGL